MVKLSRMFYKKISKIGLRKRWKMEHAKVSIKRGISPEKAAIHAYLCGDGYIRARKDNRGYPHHDIRIWPDDEELAYFIVDLFKKEYNICPKIKKLHNHFRVEIGNKPAFSNLIRLGNYTSGNWKIPKNLSKKAIKSWLKAFFDCESHVDGAHKMIALKSTNFNGLLNIHKKLYFLKIKSKVYGPYKPKNEKHSPYGILSIKGKDVFRYRKLINFNHSAKKKKLETF